jgi:hypothetical protein
MTLRQLLDEFARASTEVNRQAAFGELDQFGRFYTDEELAAGAATGGLRKPRKSAEEPAA